MALDELRHSLVASQQANIEVLVMELRQRYAQREREGPVCAETKRLLSQQAGKRRRLDQMVVDLQNWSRIGAAVGIVISGVQVATMLKEGILPWASDGGSVIASCMVKHGRRFHSALSDLDRTLEEVQLLKVEQVRLMAWLPFVISRVQAAISAAEQAFNGKLPVTPVQATSPAGDAPAEPTPLPASGSAAHVAGVPAGSSASPMHLCAQDSLAMGTIFLLKARMAELVHMQSIAKSDQAV